MKSTKLITLQRYAKYLATRYLKINPKGKGGSLYWDLQQFISEGRIKDLFEKNSPLKETFMEIYRNDIMKFAKEWSIRLHLQTPKEYLKRYNKK